VNNQITQITRRNISDELKVRAIRYSGRLEEQEFLARLFDLNSLPSKDSRYKTAYDDIWKHMTMNCDWEIDWIFFDNRFNLLHCEDSTFLKFLCETIHPAVRSDEDEIDILVEIYNKHLSNDKFEIKVIDEISGKHVFNGQEIGLTNLNQITKQAEIRRFLNSDYVNQKIKLMNSCLQTDTDIAIGTAKELIETICKSILKEKNVLIDKNWDLLRLVKETNKVLDFKPKNSSDPNEAERSIKQILGGVSSILQGITELRNSYGSGHGKEHDFKLLESKYAKFVVGLVSEISVFYLNTNGEKTELFE